VINERGIFLGDLCITPLNGHYEPVWFVWFVWFVWSVCRAQFTPLNRLPFGKFNGAGDPHRWANHKLFEAVRPCFWDLASKPVDGSTSSYIIFSKT